MCNYTPISVAEYTEYTDYVENDPTAVLPKGNGQQPRKATLSESESIYEELTGDPYEVKKNFIMTVQRNSHSKDRSFKPSLSANFTWFSRIF